MFLVTSDRRLDPRPTAVLLDLDGTMLDSADSITRALAQALADFGHPAEPKSLRRYVGPPVRETLSALLPEVPADESVAHYRALYGRSMLAATPFPQTVPLLDGLAAAGLPLAVATSKKETTAHELLLHHGLADRFAVICGAGEGDRNGDKAAVVADALRRLAAGGADVSAPIMVGDKIHDVEGAARSGVETVLVGWGYGTEEERAAALVVAGDVPELLGLLVP
ncbi:HAD hydrolase-like protein [Raineyella fluvialis]|uniref:HAD hydrolase-like protein n=1 Tax=Raineyella fluvialis TaxID=2662261 RepID=A0A5Q2FB44_9ACTN|nr:HAD hydrolase-like protein [Raineyella fluvialis]QGF23938.1 HAD hydrolase-like protein [Raineyella fluvialis]